MPAFSTGYRNSYNVRAFNAPYVVQQAAPLPPGGGGGGGGGDGGGGVSAPPLAASPFQRSVARERANAANKAATFAAGAPLPMDGAGNYNGAYGSGAAGLAAATAARSAFVGDQSARADQEDFGEGPNFFTRRRLAGDANARSNASSAANVGLTQAETGKVGAETRGLDAHTNTIVPLTAQEMAAQTDALKSRTYQNDQMTSPLVEGQRAKNRLTDAAADATGDDVRSLKQQYDALTKSHADLMKRNQFLEAQLGKRNPALDAAGAGGGATTPAQKVGAPGAPGGADVDAKERRIKMYKAAGRDDLVEEELGPKPPGMFMRLAMGSPIGKLAQKIAGAPADAPAAPASPAAPRFAEGTRSVTKDGRPVVFKNGEWIEGQ